MRSISNYPSASTQELLNTLSIVVEELVSAYDQLGFLRTEELETKKTSWLTDPTLSTQLRDRTATYAASHITTQILTYESSITALNLERSFIERLIDARPPIHHS